MKNEKPSRLEIHGKVKYSGYGIHGSVSYKDGRLIVYNQNGLWKLDIIYTVNPNAGKTFKLDTRSVIKVICKGTLLINVQIDTTQYNVYYQPLNGDYGPMKIVGALLEDIRTGKEASESQTKPSPARVTGPVRLGVTGPVKTINGWSPSPQTQNFTRYSVKDSQSQKHVQGNRVKVSLFSDDDDNGDEDDFKENIHSYKREKPDFLERGLSKAQQNSDTPFCKMKFYGGENQKYGNFGLSSTYKKRPGLMPDPSPSQNRLSDGVNYSWSKNNKSVITNKDNQHQLQQSAFQGFSNLGNTCYMNAILQSLFSLDPFTMDVFIGSNKLLRSLPQSSLYSSLHKLLSSRKRWLPELTRKEYLRNVKSAISGSAKRFLGYQQHDAHEFLGQVLDQLKDEVLKVNNSTPSPQREESDREGRSQEVINPTSQSFEFEVEHTISCTECGEEVNKTEQFNDVSLEMPRRRHSSKQCTLQNALDLFFKKEKLEYRCEKCGCKNSEVKHKFTKLPRVLILHLKRYSYCSTATFQVKMLQGIHINKYLTLESHCTEATRPPFPTLLPEIKSYSSLGSVTKDEDPEENKEESLTPRRRLNLSSGFKFKKTRPLSEINTDDGDSTRPDTSTPYKRIRLADKDEFEKTEEKKPSDMISLLDDDPDPELTKALELSLQESRNKSESFDEVDGGTEVDYKKALEMSRLESDGTSNIDHDYNSSIHTMSEEEQLRLAIEESMRDWEKSAAIIEEKQRAMDKSRNKKGEVLTSSSGNICQENSISHTQGTCVESGNNVNRTLDVNSNKCESDHQDIDSSRTCATSDRMSSEGCLELASESVISKSDKDSRISEQSSKYFKNVDSEVSLCSSPERTKKCREVGFKMAKLREKCSPGKFVSDCFSLPGGAKEDADLQIIEGSESEDKEECGDRVVIGEDDIEPDGDSTRSDESRVCDDTKSTVKHATEHHSDKDVPETNETELQLFCGEEDVIQLLDDWPDNKENEQPADVAMDTSNEDVHFGNYIDDLPEVDNEKGDLPYSYRLVSIVNHIGSSSIAGHYVSDVFSIQKQAWFSCDDNHVTKMAESEIRERRERSGYIFFYLSKDIYEDLKDHFTLTGGKS